MKNFTNPELAISIVASDVSSFMAGLKEHGLNAGRRPVQELLDGKRDEVAGFYFVDVLSTAPVDPVIVVDELVIEPVEIVDGPKASDADGVEFTEDQIAAAVEAALESGVVVVTEKVVTPEATKATPVRVKAVMKASVPKGKIKPVRKDTKIAKGLELLAGGTTEAELAGAGIGDDPVDFVNRRVTKRGYGIALVDGKVSLVFPEGVTAITYSGS